MENTWFGWVLIDGGWHVVEVWRISGCAWVLVGRGRDMAEWKYGE